ncbi:MAG: hypothetical protein ACRDU0_19855 [Mycobacterium sp.]
MLRQADLVSTSVVGTSRRYRARQGVLRGLHAALGDSSKWMTADDLPERALADAYTQPAVVTIADVDTDQATTFTAFTDPGVYSRWLGVPVTIEDERFACTLEWGTQVRGHHELVCPPELIVMHLGLRGRQRPRPRRRDDRLPPRSGA